MDKGRTWPALVIHAGEPDAEDHLAFLLDDFSPAAIEDLEEVPLPPAGLWDPTFKLSNPQTSSRQAPTPLASSLQASSHQASSLTWRVFFQTADDRDRAAAAIRARLPRLQLDYQDISDENWAARSQRALTAIEAGAFIVAPPWDLPATLPEGKTLIVIEPARGFGTGHHASTRLCLRALSELDVNGRRVLDLGTGSGVLALAAALKGASEVVAIDVDPDAIECARTSAALNTTPVDVQFIVGDFRNRMALSPHPAQNATPWLFDLVMANLTGGMLRTSAKTVRELVAPGGRLVMSGFDESERAAVRAAFDPMHERATFVEDGWVGLVLEA